MFDEFEYTKYKNLMAGISTLQAMIYVAECNRMGMLPDDEYKQFLEASRTAVMSACELSGAIIKEKGRA